MAKQFLTFTENIRLIYQTSSKTVSYFYRKYLASLLVLVMPKIVDEFKPSSDFITDRFMAMLLLEILFVINVSPMYLYYTVLPRDHLLR